MKFVKRKTGLKNNKKGDIPITILVIGVLAVCVLAILSFFISNNSVKKSFLSIDTVTESVLIKEKVSFYENLGYKKEEIKTIMNLQEDSQNNIVFKGNGVTVNFAWP